MSVVTVAIPHAVCAARRSPLRLVQMHRESMNVIPVALPHAVCAARRSPLRLATMHWKSMSVIPVASRALCVQPGALP